MKQNKIAKRDMNSKNCNLRQIGQRSIASTSLFRAVSSRSVHSRNGSRPSLSDFLNRKLHRSSVLPTSANELPFSSHLSAERSDRSAERESVKEEGLDMKTKFPIDAAFDMFKNTQKDKHGSANEVEIFYVDDIFTEGRDDKPTARKRLAVLGEDSKPVQRSKRKKIDKNEPVPYFNHYENGRGFWNDSMAGVDNEEVGGSDAWEGVGCATLGRY